MFIVRINSINGFDYVKIKMLDEWVKIKVLKDNKIKRKYVKIINVIFIIYFIFFDKWFLVIEIKYLVLVFIWFWDLKVFLKIFWKLIM